ncbi:MAG: hypothetical protein NTX75_16445 [Proteobacteria bacterium]|nr:hypothetical protein [Pseudomonadota bacterium]
MRNMITAMERKDYSDNSIAGLSYQGVVVVLGQGIGVLSLLSFFGCER